MTKKPTTTNNERPADLLFWFGDGRCSGFSARVRADVEVSIGRTDSERALGFEITNRKQLQARFVLNRDQVVELATFLHLRVPGLRKPLGRKPTQLSLVATNSPKHRLHMALQDAAMTAHPGWRDCGDGDWEADHRAPQGTKLVAWFKKAHPREAARIERELTRQLWEGD
jgi:hypothetical protein